MQRAEFEAEASGQVVSIEGGVAFLPDDLPPRIATTTRLVKALGRARGALGEFVGEARLIANQDLVTHPLAIREAALSNRIEGIHTAIPDVLRQETGVYPSDPIQRSNQAEVLNYFQTLRFGSEKIAEGWPIGVPLVSGLHRSLLKGTRGDGARLGEFRRVQVFIGREKSSAEESLRAARYVPPPPGHVEPAMRNLLEFASAEPEVDSLIDCAIMHYQFEAIHPFDDGNGRMGRILIPLQMLYRKLLDKPYLYLSAYFAERVDDYVDLMKAVSTRGAWEDWIVFFLEAVTDQAEESRRRVRTVNGLYSHYKQMVIQGTRSQAPLAAVDLIMNRVYVTVGDVQEAASCSDPTARAALGSLTNLGILERVPGSYPQVWVARELLDTVYDR